MNFEETVENLTLAQRDFLSDNWAYVLHQRVELRGRIFEVSNLRDGIPYLPAGGSLKGAMPFLFDEVTADGLQRTAWKLWKDESLYARAVQVCKDEDICWMIFRLRTGSGNPTDAYITQATSARPEEGLRLAWLRACLQAPGSPA